MRRFGRLFRYLGQSRAGVASDLLVRSGGTSVLAETPEIYGAEHLLTRRAVSPAVAKKLLDRIEWWRQYTARNGDELNNNPSFGNKLGETTTILEKSLGAVAGRVDAAFGGLRICRNDHRARLRLHGYARLIRSP